MYSLSKKVKDKIVRDCFEDVCKSAQKEESGVFKGIVNSVAKANIYIDFEKRVAVVEKKHDLSISYIYKMSELKKRFRIIKKIEEPYIFQVEINGEAVELECNQYSFEESDC